MFKSKIKFIPMRKGERFKSSITNNNAHKLLKYKATVDISEYIKKIISN